jgi:hypothetical protein
MRRKDRSAYLSKYNFDCRKTVKTGTQTKIHVQQEIVSRFFSSTTRKVDQFQYNHACKSWNAALLFFFNQKTKNITFINYEITFRNVLFYQIDYTSLHNLTIFHIISLQDYKVIRRKYGPAYLSKYNCDCKKAGTQTSRFISPGTRFLTKFTFNTKTIMLFCTWLWKLKIHLQTIKVRVIK